MYLAINPRRTGTAISINGADKWLVHNYLYREKEGEQSDRDWAIRTIFGVGADFRYTILSNEDWVGRRLTADRYRDRRVFICGDAAHLWIPFSGYGMNAGIADAANLSWILAAVLKGWGGPALLDAYEQERQPIADQVSHYAMNMALDNIRERGDPPPEIESDGSEGEQARARVGKYLYDLNVQQFCCGGLNFGYFYDRSPIIAYDGDSAPPYTMYDFSQSSVPGYHTPHVWLNEKQPLFDAFGPDYTLIRTDSAVSVDGLLNAATRRGFPLKLLDVAVPGAVELYEKKLVLSRPDQHVAWRGDEPRYETMHATMEASGIKLRRLPMPTENTDHSSQGFAFRDDQIAKDPNLVIKFGRAMAKSTVACNANVEGCVKAFWKANPTLKPIEGAEEDKLRRDAHVVGVRMERLLWFRRGEPEQIGAFSDVDWKLVIQELEKGEVIQKTDIPLNRFYTNEFVAKFNEFDKAAVIASAQGYK